MGGGGKAPSPPPLPEPEPIPEPEKDPISKVLRESGAKKLRGKTGYRGTIVTNPLGTQGGGGTNALGALFNNVTSSKT